MRPRCFGKYGNTDCISVICFHFKKCHAKYWELKKKRKNEKKYVPKSKIFPRKRKS
jgi:hypothetical protein